MTRPLHMQSDLTESPEIRLPTVDEKMLPELIQRQISKLNELDTGVKAALCAAAQAEDLAESAAKQSAGWSLFGDKKKEAIEELQKVSVQLAEALQSGATAQKVSFELQTRLADVTKYLFTLGVGNIAANRTVVRELELRLSDASEEELSELARQEMASVIRQLKEQEDLLQKQDQMREGLKEHDRKIRYLLDRTDDLDLQQRGLASRIDAIGQVSEEQRQEILALHQQVAAQHAGLESLAAAHAQESSRAEHASKNVLAWSKDLEVRIQEQDVQQRSLASMIESMVQASERQQQAISTMQKQALAQQAGLEELVTALAQSRSAWTLRTTLVAILATALPAAVYFLR